MILKRADDISEQFFKKTVLDLEPSQKSEFSPSRYNFFFKDAEYEGDFDNKLGLVIVCEDNGYVVNNNLKLHSVQIKDKKITMYYIHNSKKKEFANYWFL